MGRQRTDHEPGTERTEAERGTFAEGQAGDAAVDRDPSRQHFARGQEAREHRHEGTFAEGQAEHEPHPEDAAHGRFARGDESEDDDERADGGDGAE